MVVWLEILNAVVGIAVAILCFFAYFKWEKKEGLSTVSKIFALMGYLFLVFASLNVVWAFDLVQTSPEEISAMSTAFNIARTIMLLFILHKTFGERKTLALFNVYWIAIIVTIWLKFDALRAADVISFVIPLLLFVYLTLKSNYYLKKAGIIGIFYSMTSLTFLSLMIRGMKYEDIFWFVEGIMFMGILYYLYLDINNLGIMQPKKKITHRSRDNLSKILTPTKHFLIIFFLIGFTFLSTVSIHEFGHAIIGKYYGCDVNKIVIYDTSSAGYTELKCKEPYSNTLLTLGGVILTTLVGFLFMLLSLNLTNTISYMILGFGFLMSYGDLLDIGISQSIRFIIAVSGFIILIFGIIKLTGYCLSQKECSGEEFVSEGKDTNTKEHHLKK